MAPKALLATSGMLAPDLDDMENTFAPIPEPESSNLNMYAHYAIPSEEDKDTLDPEEDEERAAEGGQAGDEAALSESMTNGTSA
ncbi:hypothetical protein B0T16DRAFT_455784 [Cercophora newfieldiana]|uniref:Uncharacterized protein n=1 Tax=Cercophora newfieldiana TaxID=92897 RepID=A0AA39Y924_9PEZI|nr:hypothetical protein B0T16DRAFT_455784 [Cercophora newfieldiana]